MEQRTRKCRIALASGTNHWNAVGYCCAPDQELEGRARDFEGADEGVHIFWVEVEVPIFQTQMIRAEAKPATCPSCGYTKRDAEIHGDHRLCGQPDPEQWAEGGGDENCKGGQ